MAPNLILIVFLIVVSLSLTAGYSLSSRDAYSKQEDESYVMATSDQESSMVVVEDLVKSRLQASSEVIVNNVAHKSTSKKGGKKKHKGKKIGPWGFAALFGIILVILLVIFSVIYVFHLKRKTKNAQSTEQGITTGKVNESSETQTSKTEDHV